MNAEMSVEILLIPDAPAPLAEIPTEPPVTAADPAKTKALIHALSEALMFKLPPALMPESDTYARTSTGDSWVDVVHPIRFSAMETPIETPIPAPPPPPRAAEAAMTFASILDVLVD